MVQEQMAFRCPDARLIGIGYISATRREFYLHATVEKTFRDYISGYMKRAEDARIARVVRRLGCQEDRLCEMLDRKATEENYQAFGKINELIASVDMDKAQKLFITLRIFIHET